MSYNILVVDDDEHTQTLISSFLKSEGYNYKILSDSKNALKEIYKNQYDLVILDISMPEVSGLDILETLREDEMYKKTNVLMLTSSSNRKDVLNASGLNVSDYIIKPPSKADFLQRVEEALVNNFFSNGYSFNKNTAENKGSFPITFYVKSISQKGMVLKGNIPLPVGYVIEKIKLPLFEEVNINQNNYNVRLCTDNKDGTYSYTISFSNLNASDKKKIKNWISNEYFLKKMIPNKSA